MKTETFIKKFWKNVYGRQLKEVSSPQVVPVNLTVHIVDDGDDFPMIMVAEAKDGSRKVWREVKP